MKKLLLIPALIVLLTACGATQEPSPIVVTATVEAITPTSLPVEPTDTLPPVESTDTPRPTETSLPTNTPRPKPTNTPVQPTEPPPTEPPATQTSVPAEPSATQVPPTEVPATQPPPPTEVPPTEPPSPPPATEIPPTELPAPAQVIVAGVYNSGKVEHVTIQNVGGGDANLSGWSVSGSKGDERYIYPSGYILPAGQTMRLHSGQGGTDAPPWDIYWTTKNVWNNDGETVYLWDAAGNLVHELTY